MPRYAIVDSEGNVVNAVIVADSGTDWQPPDGTSSVLHDEASPGGTLIDGVYTPPTPPDPPEE